MTVSRQDFEDAVAAYWGSKQTQSELSAIKDRVGLGTAGSVRAGKHSDSIAALLAKFFLEAGYPLDAIRVTKSQGLELPVYYHPQKQWDVVVAHKNTLVAAFELKALGAPSFGNNYNNRVEEALGSAVDLRRAVLANLFPGEKPWIGYFFIMEDAAARAARSRQQRVLCRLARFGSVDHIRTDLGSFVRRMPAEGLYDAVCYFTSSADMPQPIELVANLDWRHFSASIRVCITYLQELGIP